MASGAACSRWGLRSGHLTGAAPQFCSVLWKALPQAARREYLPSFLGFSCTAERDLPSWSSWRGEGRCFLKVPLSAPGPAQFLQNLQAVADLLCHFFLCERKAWFLESRAVQKPESPVPCAV